MKVSIIYQLAVLLFVDKTDSCTTALQYSKEQLNIATRFHAKSTEGSFMYFVHAFIYFKMSSKCAYESKRIAMRSNAFDYLKISLEVSPIANLV